MVQRTFPPSVLVTLAVLAASSSPTFAQRQTGSVLLQQVLISETDGTLTVTLAATGEISGVLKAAGAEGKRLYIDLEGVRSAVAPTTPVGRGALRQIRVGLFSAQPLVTRVVFDLETVRSSRIEPGADARQLRVILESPAASQPSPSSPYLDWFTVMERRIGIVLQATSQAIATRDGGLVPLASEWARLAREIESMEAPGPFATTHALLLQAVRLGRQEAERGQASPAAGSPAPADDVNPRLVLARARAALPAK